MIDKDGRSRLACVGIAVLVVLALAACSSPTPTAAPAPQATNVPSAPVQPAATQPPVKETVIVKETVVVPPTTTPTVAPTASATAKPGGVAPKPTSAGKLDFTVEFGPSAPREGDNKVQVSVILHITGGAPPFQVKEEGAVQNVTKRVDGVQYVRDWHNCGFDEFVTIIVASADGQTASLKTGIPYGSYKCP